MIRRFTALLALASFALLFSSAGAQITTFPAPPSSATVTPQVVAAGDSSDHIDLAVNRGAARASAALALRLYDAGGNPITKFSASWATSNAAVASVAAGTVIARARGEAVISATITASPR